VKQLIETTFPCKTGNCIETRNEALFWVDEYPDKIELGRNRKKSFIVLYTEDELLFTVKNQTQKDVHFLAIDQGIFWGTEEYEHGRCDFALFDDIRFCFVENKDVNLKHRGDERKEAITQLSETITKFKQHLNFGNYILEAQISFKAKKIFPRQRSQNQQRATDFFDETGAELFENNDIEF
jgi:hypothetical protein